MNLRRLGGRLRAFLGRASRFHQVQLSEKCCTSISDTRSICLPAQFLSTAAELQVEFIVSWPLFRLKSCRALSANLLSADNLEPTRLPCRLHRAGSRNCVRITLPPEAARKSPTLELEVVDSSRRLRLRTYQFQVLDPARIERLMLDSLKVRHHRIWVLSRNRWHLAEALIPQSSDFVVVEVVIGGSDFANFVSPPDGSVTFSLLTPDERVGLSRTAFRCSGAPQVIRSDPIPLREGEVFGGPGRYTIAASLGGRDLVRTSFRLVGERDLLQQVKVGRIDIQAETHDGTIVSGLGTLHWTEHRAIQLSLEVETAIRAPNTLVHCSVSASQGSTLIRPEEFLLPLDCLHRHVRLRKIELVFPASRLEKPVRLLVNACIGEHQKTSSTLIILPAERIANFEGQLTGDIKNLPLDESEYDEILRRLRLPNPPSPRRKFWRDPV